MRNAIVIGLAIIAVLAAGVWGVGQFGGAFTGGVGEPQAPIVREPEIVVAEAPAQPPASNPQASLRTAPATPTPTKPAAALTPAPVAPAPVAPATSAPASPEPAATAPATTEPPATAPATTEPVAPAKPSLTTTLDGKGGLQLPALPKLPGQQQQPQAQAQLQSQPQTQAAPAQPEVTVQPQVQAQAQPQARVAPPAEPQARAQVQADEPRVMPQQAGVSVAPTPVGLEAQFKSRKVTYNRPPQKLALDKAIDVSLVINATADESAGQEALQGFPGTIVERDVELSDTVSAQLTGVGFDITSQTVERQRLSGKVINRWAWRVTPTEIGQHTMILEIFGYASGSLDAEPLDAYRDVIVVEVQQFDQIVSWAKGVQPLFAVLAALAAIGSAIFAFLRFREEKKQTKKLSE